MTRSEIHRTSAPATETVPRPGSGRARTLLSSRAGAVLLPTLLLVVAAFGFRSIGLTTASSRVDELTYAELASMLAAGRLPDLFGGPFFLHPPGGLLLDAARSGCSGCAGPHGPGVRAALGARRSRCRSGAAGLPGDPLRHHPDGRRRRRPRPRPRPVRAPQRHPGDARDAHDDLPHGRARSGCSSRSPSRPAGCGSCSRCARACCWGARCSPRTCRRSRVAVLLVLGCRAPDRAARHGPAGRRGRAAALRRLSSRSFARAGLLPAWWDAKTFGLRRMVGAEQVTGFNMPNAPSLVSRLIVQVSRFGTSYVLLAACLVVGVLAACSPHATRRLVGLPRGGRGAARRVRGGGRHARGAVRLRRRGRRACRRWRARRATPRRAVRLRRLLSVAAVVFLVATAVLGVRARSAHDDGFLQVRDVDARPRCPPGTRVGLTGVTAEFALLPHAGYGVWPSLSSLADNGRRVRHDAEPDPVAGVRLRRARAAGLARGERQAGVRADRSDQRDHHVWFIDKDALHAGRRGPRRVPRDERGRRGWRTSCAGVGGAWRWSARRCSSPHAACHRGPAEPGQCAAGAHVRCPGRVLRRGPGRRAARGRGAVRRAGPGGAASSPRRSSRRGLHRRSAGAPRPVHGRGPRVVLTPGLQYPPAWVRDLPGGRLPRPERRREPRRRRGRPRLQRGGPRRRRGATSAGSPPSSASTGRGGPGRHERRPASSATPARTPAGPAHAYWAFDAAAQSGAGLADGMTPTPMPGWVPGSASGGGPVDAAGRSTVVHWYPGAGPGRSSGRSAALREVGFTGRVHIPVAGRGVLPADLAERRRRPARRPRRPGRSAGAGTGLPGRVQLALAIAGADRRRHAASTSTSPGSTTSPPSRPARPDATPAGAGRTTSRRAARRARQLDSWSAQRWTIALPAPPVCGVVGENPGPPDAPYTGGATTPTPLAEQLVHCAPPTRPACGMTTFLFAFEDDLFAGASDVVGWTTTRAASLRPNGGDEPAARAAPGLRGPRHARCGRRLAAHPRDQPPAGRARAGGHRADDPFPGCADRVQDGVRYLHVGRGPAGTRWTRLLGYVRACPRRSAGLPDAGPGRRGLLRAVLHDGGAAVDPAPDHRRGAVAARQGEEPPVPAAAAPAGTAGRAQPPPARRGVRGHRPTSCARSTRRLGSR